MSVVAKWSPISATAELFFYKPVALPVTKPTAAKHLIELKALTTSRESNQLGKKKDIKLPLSWLFDNDSHVCIE